MSRTLSFSVVCLALIGFAGTASAQDGTGGLIDSCTAKVGDRVACTDVVTQIDAQLFALDASGKGTLKKALSLESGAHLLALMVSSFNAKIGALNSRVGILEDGAVDVTAHLGALDEEVQGYKGKVKALEADYAARTATIEGRLDQTDAAVGDLQAEVAAYQGDNLSYYQQVVALQEFAESAVAGLGARVGTVESEIAGILAIINDPTFDTLIAEADEYIGALPAIRQGLVDANDRIDRVDGKVASLAQGSGCATAYSERVGAGKPVGICCSDALVAGDFTIDIDASYDGWGRIAAGETAEFAIFDANGETTELIGVVNPTRAHFDNPDAIVFTADTLHRMATGKALAGAPNTRDPYVEDGLKAFNGILESLRVQVTDLADDTAASFDDVKLTQGLLKDDLAANKLALGKVEARVGALETDVSDLWQAYDATAQESSDNRKGIIGLWEFVDEMAQDTSRNSKAIVGLQGQIADLTKQVDGLRTELHTIGDSFARGHTVRVAYVASTEGGTTFDGIDVADVATYPGAAYTVDFDGFDAIDILNGVATAPCSEVKTKDGKIVMFEGTTPLKICVGDPAQITPGIGWVDLRTAHTMHTGDGGFNMVMTLAESHGY